MRKDHDADEPFPARLIASGICIMLSLVVLSALISWQMGARAKSTMSDQIAVITAVERLDVLETARVLTLEKVIRGGGDSAHLKARAEVQRTLEQLRQAIRIPANLRTFAELKLSHSKLIEFEDGVIELSAAGQFAGAKNILRSRPYIANLDLFQRSNLSIERRAREYVDRNTQLLENFRYVNLALSILSALLVLVAWMTIVRPARRWGAQLVAARAKAEEAAVAKSSFLAMMSHEIRTPLNSIIGFTDLLLQEPQLPAEQRHRLSLIKNSSDALLTVINDVLDYSRIEAGAIEFVHQPFSFEHLSKTTVAIVAQSAEAKGLAIEMRLDKDLAHYYTGDPHRLRQILLNLLNNAIKFTDTGHVSLSVERRSHGITRDSICISVTDTGVGVAEDHLGKVFDHFFQVGSSAARTPGGTGLGLAICKRLVEGMGGQIGLTSTPGLGSKFWLELSLAPAAATVESESEQAALTNFAPARILLAEDLPINQELALAVLERAGHHVRVASDGFEALEMVQREEFDLVLMDIQMPKMDGITATKNIRQLNSSAKHVPIVAMTANVLPEQVERFRREGMDDFVGKPVRQADLLCAVERALAKKNDPLANDQPDSPEIPHFDEAEYASAAAILSPSRMRDHLNKLRLDLEAGTTGWVTQAERARLAHRLVSFTGMLGFLQASSRFRDLERACLENQSSAVELEMATEASATAIEKINELLGERSNHSTTEQAAA